MELKEYLNIVRKRLLLVILITLSCTLISAVVSYFVIKPAYKADISVLIGQNQKSDSATKENYNDVMMYQKMVKTYSIFVQTKTVANDVINELNLDMNADQLIKMISVAPKGDTEFLTITVKSKDKSQVAKIANQIAKSLKKESIEIYNQDNIKLVDDAVEPTSPDSPRPLLNIAVALFVGLMLSIGIVFLIEYLDNTVKDEEELTRLLGVPVIGVIPTIEE
ncbi:YveK family protein [Clostridium folliculivorans]|uniref:Capsular polysaccharide biosynthesis protein n=1 Tax=Clostridium folliculivorans TaxID=2886038 RepID=A0A9W6D951_9CLOT|nr:Wzz/FepE/Etk N-terminal domain-containing protein [Clostridium folliculivorans]GKU23940.1 capsular polysaccharide biosynthesis protein [Clostridium folliculivorans]GKU30055.1 capsular polysaccharide biosynthesis protein [Clostridium folliculivorans]